MQKLPEAPDWKRGNACAKKRNRRNKKKESCSFSTVTIPKSFLLEVEGTMHQSRDDALANFSISSNLRSSLLRCSTRPNEWGTQ